MENVGDDCFLRRVLGIGMCYNHTICIGWSAGRENRTIDSFDTFIRGNYQPLSALRTPEPELLNLASAVKSPRGAYKNPRPTSYFELQ